MKDLQLLKVKSFTRDRIPNPFPGGELPWQTYHTVRNALVRACRPYGPTGPMGVITITPDVEDPYRAVIHDPSFWERGDPEPVYFVVDAQYNAERYCYLELLSDDALNAGWLQAATTALREFDGWGLGVGNIPDSYLLIFGNRLLVKGRLANCTSAADVIETARRLLKRGRKKWWQFWR